MIIGLNHGLTEELHIIFSEGFKELVAHHFVDFFDLYRSSILLCYDTLGYHALAESGHIYTLTDVTELFFHGLFVVGSFDRDGYDASARSFCGKRTVHLYLLSISISLI